MKVWIAAAIRQSGVVGRAFVEKLIARKLVAQPEQLNQMVLDMASHWIAGIPAAVDGQISRVAKRLALIGLSGEIATAVGLTGWKREEAMLAAAQMFSDWYDRHYGAKRDAADAFVVALQQFLSTHREKLNEVGHSVVAGDDPIGWCDASRIYLPPTT